MKVRSGDPLLDHRHDLLTCLQDARRIGSVGRAQVKVMRTAFDINGRQRRRHRHAKTARGPRIEVAVGERDVRIEAQVGDVLAAELDVRPFETRSDAPLREARVRERLEVPVLFLEHVVDAIGAHGHDEFRARLIRPAEIAEARRT